MLSPGWVEKLQDRLKLVPQQLISTMNKEIGYQGGSVT